MKKEILVVGGGFAGLWAALAGARELLLGGRQPDVAMISPDGFLTMRPRLYESNPEKLRVPIEPVLNALEVELISARVQTVDPAKQSLSIDIQGKGTRDIGYAALVLAAGSELQVPAIPGADKYSFNIDTYAAAVSLDRHLCSIMQSPHKAGHQTILVVGAGITGVELATEMRGMLRQYANAETVDKVRIILVQRSASLVRALGENVVPIVTDALQQADVELVLAESLRSIEADSVTFSNGQRIACCTTIATTGLRANSLAASLGAETDRYGRLAVDEMLRVQGLSDIFAAGDIARAFADGAQLALMSCQHAMKMGKFAGYNAARQLLGLSQAPYFQPDYVTCIDLGDSGAVFTSGWDRQVQMTGCEAKSRKRTINTQWIYPPRTDRAALLAAADIHASHR